MTRVFRLAFVFTAACAAYFAAAASAGDIQLSGVIPPTLLLIGIVVPFVAYPAFRAYELAILLPVFLNPVFFVPATAALGFAHYYTSRNIYSTLKDTVLVVMALFVGKYLREAMLATEHQLVYLILIVSLFLVFACTLWIFEHRAPLARKALLLAILILLSGFWFYRFLRPLPMVDVGPYFDQPLAVSGMEHVRAADCQACHPREYREWSRSYHAKAYTNGVFQAELQVQAFTDSCPLCHAPLEQQVAEEAPYDFRREGVTCLGCHSRGGRLVGRRNVPNDAHPTTAMTNPSEVCVRCHVASKHIRGVIPCGAVAEEGSFGLEWVIADGSQLSCVECHMREEDGTVAHGFPGGHDRDMLNRALKIGVHWDHEDLVVTVSNVGASHKVPTGVPGRRLVIRILAGETVLEEFTLNRSQIWRPFIATYSDDRLSAGEGREYRFLEEVTDTASHVEVVYQLDDPIRFRRVMQREPLGEENEIRIFNYRVVREPAK